MVKLIKLVGNSAVGGSTPDKVINNVFSNSITVKPKSRIALRACQVNFDDTSAQRDFTVPIGSDTFSYAIGSATTDVVNVQIPQPAAARADPDGNYKTASLVVTAMTEAANSTAPPASTASRYSGLHHRYLINGDNKTVIQTFKADEEDAEFQNWIETANGKSVALSTTINATKSLTLLTAGTGYTAGPASTTGGSGTGLIVELTVDAGAVTDILIRNGGDGEYVDGEIITVSTGGTGCTFQLHACDLNQAEIVPLVSSTQTFKLDSPAACTWAIRPLDGDDDIAYGLQILGNGKYQALLNDTELSTPSTFNASIDDTITIVKVGKTITITATSTLGTYTQSGDLGVSASGYNFITEQNFMNTLQIGAGQPLALRAASTQTLAGLDQGDGTTHQITLIWSSDQNNDKAKRIPIAAQLGFTSGNRYTNNGAPTTITSENSATGLIANSGVLVVIDGLDLDTYMGGVNRGPSNVNILDVLFEDPNKPRTISQIVSFPMPLDLKNEREVIIRDLRVRFLDSNLKPRSFVGNPSVVLELYGPEESS